MRSLIAKFAAASMPLLAMMATNVAVDPASVFHEAPEREMARLLRAGRPVAGVLDFDERLLQKYMIDSLPASPDIVVIGSSRTMSLQAADFPGMAFYNASVSAPVVDDLIALAGELARVDRLPKRLILSIDPWLFNRHASHDGWQAMREGHDLVLGSANQTQPRRHEATKKSRMSRLLDYGEILSPAYFQASLRSLRAEGGRPRPRAATSDENGWIAPDGSRTYPLVFRSRDRAVVAQAALQHVTAANTYLEDFNELDGGIRDELATLLRFLRARGVASELLLVPYHPLTFDLLAASPAVGRRINLTAEPYVRRLAQEAGVPVLGSLDPRRVGCSDAEFLDGVHPREECLARAIKM